jgi:hypothetical protein
MLKQNYEHGRKSVGTIANGRILLSRVGSHRAVAVYVATFMAGYTECHVVSDDARTSLFTARALRDCDFDELEFFFVNNRVRLEDGRVVSAYLEKRDDYVPFWTVTVAPIAYPRF